MTKEDVCALLCVDVAHTNVHVHTGGHDGTIGLNETNGEDVGGMTGVKSDREG
jgi:hypothetical protein